MSNYGENTIEVKKQIWNSKKEKENFDMDYFRKMYDEIQELKRKGVKGANIDKYYAAINQYKEAEKYMKLYKETGKSYHKTSAESLKREADRWMKEVKESIHNNSKEQGYYAKLIAEKRNGSDMREAYFESTDGTFMGWTESEAEEKLKRFPRKHAKLEKYLVPKGERGRYLTDFSEKERV